MVKEEQRKLLYNCMKAAACQVDRGRMREVVRDLRDCDDWVDVLACRRGTSAPQCPVHQSSIGERGLCSLSGGAPPKSLVLDPRVED